MPLTEHDEHVIATYAAALAEALAAVTPPLSEARQERLAVLLTEPLPAAGEPDLDGGANDT